VASSDVRFWAVIARPRATELRFRDGDDAWPEMAWFHLLGPRPRSALVS